MAFWYLKTITILTGIGTVLLWARNILWMIRQHRQHQARQAQLTEPMLIALADAVKVPDPLEDAFIALEAEVRLREATKHQPLARPDINDPSRVNTRMLSFYRPRYDDIKVKIDMRKHGHS